MMVGVHAALLMLASLPAPGPATVEPPTPVAAEVAPASEPEDRPPPPSELPLPAPPAKAPRPVPLKPSAPSIAPVRADRVAGGDHFRLTVKGGVVHVWTPPGFDAS